MGKQIAIVENIDFLVETNSLNEESISFYNLPEGIKDVSEIYNSEDFKRFKEERLISIEKIETGILLDRVLQGGIPRGKMTVLAGKSNTGKVGLIDYLKHINEEPPKALKIKEWLSKNKK